MVSWLYVRCLWEFPLFVGNWTWAITDVQIHMSIFRTVKRVFMSCMMSTEDFGNTVIDWCQQKPNQIMTHLKIIISTKTPTSVQLAEKSNKFEASKSFQKSTSVLTINFIVKHVGIDYCAGGTHSTRGARTPNNSLFWFLPHHSLPSRCKPN